MNLSSMVWKSTSIYIYGQTSDTMGMFDYVDFEANCPICGNYLTEWQSKDGPCGMMEIPVTAVDQFYTSCKRCGTWIHYQIRRMVDNEGKTYLMFVPETEMLDKDKLRGVLFAEAL